MHALNSEGFYNNKRIHSSLEYLTPNEMEAKFKANEIIPVLPMSQNGIIMQNGELKKFA